jgi:hypothetical protein
MTRSDRSASDTKAVLRFLVAAINSGSTMRLQEQFPDIFAGETRLAADHLPPGVVQDTACALHSLGVDGEAGVNVLLQHTVTAVDAAPLLSCSPTDAVSLAEGGLLGGLRVSGNWLISRRSIEIHKFWVESDEWWSDNSDDGARPPWP